MRTPVSILVATLALLTTGPIPPAHAGTEPPRFENAKLLPVFGAEGDRFGDAVAVSGRTVVVGAEADDDAGNFSGTAWVYIQPADGWDGTLLQNARLIPSDTAAGDGFGGSVAIDGDVIVVGAQGADGSAADSGSVYVFVEPPGGWSGLTVHESAKLIASDGATDDSFGYSVAISGGTIVVGALGGDDNGGDSGSAYVFVEPAGGWSGVLTEDAKLLPDDGVAGDEFGGRVAVCGETVVVGAWYNGNTGAAYVFREPAGGWSGVLAQRAKLLPSEAGALGSFGLSVGVEGPDVVVGAYDAAYVYSEPPGGWLGTLTEIAELSASGGTSFRSVSISGSRIVVGDPRRDEGAVDTGATYLFIRPGAGWVGTLTERAKLLASDRAANDFLGVAVGVDGDLVVAGAPRDDDNGNDSGSAYVFDFVLFTDGFENGDTAAWSSTAP